MGWGSETFLKDWDEVVKVQSQATLDGSPVAQAVIKFMEDEKEYTATSSELHSKLKVVAAQLGVDVDRDKAWPKSARWLWRRIKEVLPFLVAAGIEASRDRPDKGPVITLRRTPTNDASNASTDETRPDKGKYAGNSGGANASSNASENPAETKGSVNTGIRYGDFSETPASLDARPDEDVTIADLKARREIASALRQLFEDHPETRKQTLRQIAEDLYIWTDLGYTPTGEDVQHALAGVK